MKSSRSRIILRTACCLLALVLLLGILPVYAADPVVDLSVGSVTDPLKKNQGSTQSMICHGASWVGAYSLFDVGSGTYLVYRIKVPANEAATVLVDYKNWEGVGNGGVHQYTQQPKIRWYVTDDAIDTSFDGDVSDWDEVAANEKISLKTYSYSYSLAESDSKERTLYACMKFCDNNQSAQGQAGWNDGAWVDNVTFTTDASQPQTPATPPEDDTLSGPSVDMVENVTVFDALKSNHTAEYALMQTGRWVDTYSLYDLGVGQFILYRITLPDADGVQVTVDYKDWTDVGNGGIHRYSEKPKTLWYVSEKQPSADFNGNTSGWTRIPAEEELSADTFTYTYTLMENDKSAKARTIYACMVFSSNDSAYHGQAGGNDGAWIDGITFDRLVNEQTPVSGVTLDKSELKLSFDKTGQLSATIAPKNATLRKLSWSSSEPSIVSVDKDGTVKAMGPGTATVTVKTEDGGFTAQCTVTVPDDVTEIVLRPGEPLDTKVTATLAGDPMGYPKAWYYDNNGKADATQIVEWEGVTFRDLTNNAYVIYKLLVPADHNARILLDMVTDYRNTGGQVVNGVATNGTPRMHIFYTAESITLATMDDALWIPADRDEDWNESKSDYAFTVSSMSGEDRYVYVKLSSTNVAGQGAWIKSLGFDTIVPTPTEPVVLAAGRTEYTVGEKYDPRGLALGMRYSDGSTAVLSPEDYTFDKTAALTQKDTQLTLTTKEGDLTLTIPLTVLPKDGEQSKTLSTGLVAGIVGGVLAIAAATTTILLTRKGKGKGKK